jgi:predicted ATPase/class 3 adenylate cyclase
VAPQGTVTLLFSDIEGSTRLLQEMGDGYAELLQAHRRLLREAFGANNGYEVDTEGDAFFVAFASASDAVAAAAAAQRALVEHPWPPGCAIRVRMGVHTGEPRLIDGTYVGLDVHRAARVMTAGHGGQVILSHETRTLAGGRVEVVDLGEHLLKDFAGPQRLHQLSVDGLRSDFPPLRTISNSNLPRPASMFVGRARELEELVALLRDGARLVTLTGPGGSGKTRLAIETAAELVSSRKSGVTWIPLAAVRDPSLVTGAIAQTLGAGDDLHGHVGDRDPLLVLDNLEQIIDAARDLGAFVRACPNVALLVTSREALRIDGEREYPVAPLEHADAIRLYSARTASEPTPAVSELCRRLDDLPLAIELAAARARALGPDRLLERLSHRLDLLAGGRDLDPRQQTLRATIAWSHDLLGLPEQQLFARLSVFAGGATLQAIEDICEADLDELASLVDKSLLNRSGDRFWMYETIREYASERLADDVRAVELADNHLAWYLALAERARAEASGDGADPWFDRLDADHDNLRAALDRARMLTDSASEQRLASALWRFWAGRGYISEGFHALDAAIARGGDATADALLGRCYLGSIATSIDFGSLLEDGMEVLAACKRNDDRLLEVETRTLLGELLAGLGRMAEADAMLSRAIEISAGEFHAEAGEAIGWWLITALWGPLPARAGIERCVEARRRAPGNATVRAFSLVEQAALEAMCGSFDKARRLLAEGREVFRSLDLKVYDANTAQEMYIVEMLAGDPEAAVRDLTSAYERLWDMGERSFLSTIAGYLANALVETGELDEAERYAGLSAALSAPDDYASQSEWRGARALLAAHAGEFESAVRFCNDALAFLEPTDALVHHASVLRTLGRVLELAGRLDESTRAFGSALALCEQKGNLVTAAEVRSRLERLAPLA